MSDFPNGRHTDYDHEYLIQVSDITTVEADRLTRALRGNLHSYETNYVGGDLEFYSSKDDRKYNMRDIAVWVLEQLERYADVHVRETRYIPESDSYDSEESDFAELEPDEKQLRIERMTSE
jgi:hypothetical protein